MNLELYSDRAKQAVQSAQTLALARKHQHFAPEHLLKVLLEERDGLARNFDLGLAVDLNRQGDAVRHQQFSRCYAPYRRRPYAR